MNELTTSPKPASEPHHADDQDDIIYPSTLSFVLVHLALVALVPSTLPPMITGRAPRREHHKLPEATPNKLPEGAPT